MSRFFLELKFKRQTKLKSKAKNRFRLRITPYCLWNHPARLFSSRIVYSSSFSPSFLSLSLSLLPVVPKPLILYLSHTYTHTFSILFHLLPPFSHSTSVSNLRHTRIQTRIIHTCIADGRNGGCKAILKKKRLHFYPLMLKCAPHVKRSRRNDVFVSHSLLVAAALLFACICFSFILFLSLFFLYSDVNI